MRRMPTLLRTLAALLMVPLAAQAPVPDRLEQLLWQGAQSANSVPAYDTYLRRYPAGAYSEEARAALAKLGVAPPAAPVPQPAAPTPVTPASAASAAPVVAAPVAVTAPPPPPVAPAVQQAATASEDTPSPLFLCRPSASATVALDRASEAEIGAYLEATRTNSVEAYQRYLDNYPQGLFAPAVVAVVKERTARAKQFAATPVPGPASAKLRRPIVAAAEDFPAEARRAGQSGTASAVWEIAEDGCVQSCRIEQSSGSPALDAASCRLATAKGRYDPARDAAGKPIRSIGSGSIAWAAAK